MGIDFSHCDAHWGYGGFNRFRGKLAAEIGICLDLMEGFWKGGRVETSVLAKRLDLDEVWWLPKEPYKWDNISDPITKLLNHSDCDGEISPEDCAVVAPRLRELVEGWDDGHYDKEGALELAGGMELAAEKKESLEFC